jgi:autotransporter-associated beta strand protein
MKPRKIRSILTAASALLLAPAAFAADGTWNTTVTPSSWNTPGNWLVNTIADGSGFTANFSTLDITADTTVTLDTDRTIGNLIFGDTATGSAAGWILAGAGDPVGKLTLAGTTPTITVNALGTGKNTTITATLEGTAGFTKAGAGTLVLNNTTNTISGPVVLSAGLLNIQSRPLTGATSVAINAGTLVSATGGFKPMGDATITFGGGNLQYNNDPGYDYSAQFATTANQQYRINVISAGTPSVPRVATFSSDLSSVGGTLTKLGTGTLVLAGPNTFTGNTIISAGTLELSHPLALQNSPINTASTVVGTSTSGLVLTGVTSPTFGGLTGNKALASLFNTDSGNYGLVINVTLNPGTGADYSYGAAIADGAGGMSLTKSGPGKQSLTVANSYTGGTIINGGTLNYGNASALSSGPISFTGDSILQAGVATTLANDISVATDVIGTIGTSSFATVLSGAITGTGILAKGGTNTLNLTGGEANTISGGVIVYSGRLNVVDGLSLRNTGPVTVSSGGSLNYSNNFLPDDEMANDIAISGPGVVGFGALNLQGNVNATGAITLADDATISHNFNNATISGSITGVNRNLTLTTVNPAQAGIVISAPISLGTGGITVNGADGPPETPETNTVTLSGTNSYTGETHVVTGTLILSGNARINDSAAVRINAGAVLQLDFAGTDTVGALYLGGDPNPKADGTYGSFDSLATNKSADFAGTGILQVGGSSGNNFANWASSQMPPVTGGANGDDDNDGVTNLVEYALVDGGERGVFSGNTITFTKRGAPYGGDLTYIIETSETLSGTWTAVVTHGPAELGLPISYNLNPVPGTPKKFARLKVVQAP